jgi:myo-inositol-1(or 4)-monophosphatase
MANHELLKRIEAAKHAVLAQTELLHREFGRAESRWKSDGTRVTAVDVAISENIFRELAAQFSDDQFFSEELAETDAPIPVTAEFSWVLDPIDGTNNFALGIPHCAISLGLCVRGEPVYGVIYDLARRATIHGGPGFGVWDMEAPARVRPELPQAQSLVGIHTPTRRAEAEAGKAVFENFKIRGLGSSTLHLAYTAVGLLNGVVEYNNKVWDIAAAAALVAEGGGELHFLSVAPFPMREFTLKAPPVQYVAGNPAMCRALLSGLGR